MRTPLSSCSKNLVSAPCWNGDRCIKGCVVACGTLVIVPSRLVCNPDKGEMNAEDESCGRGELGLEVKCNIPPLLDVLA